MRGRACCAGTGAGIRAKIQFRVSKAYFWNFFCDNPARKPLQDSRLAYTRRSNELHHEFNVRRTKNKCRYVPRGSTLSAETVLANIRVRQRPKTDGKTSGNAYFGWYAGSLHATISLGEKLAKENQLSFISSNHGIELSGLRQLGQVDALIVRTKHTAA